MTQVFRFRSLIKSSVTIILLIAATAAHSAALSTAITYQGVLKDGGLPANNNYNFVFRLFDNPVAGTQVGPDVSLDGVSVIDGLFNVELDFGDVFDGTALWLEVEVGGTTLGTRQSLTPSPFALYAASAPGNTLHDAYNEGGAGAGSMITADSGPVLIDGTAGTNGLEIHNVSLLQKAREPKLIRTLNTGESSIVQGIAVQGRYAVLITGGSLRIIDVTDPAAVERVGFVALGRTGKDLAVAGRYAYVLNDAPELQVIDLSEPTAPAVVGSLSLGGDPTSVFVSGRHAYVVNRTNNDLITINVSDPNNPIQVGNVGLGNDPLDVFVAGKYAYVSDAAGLRIIDVDDPANPVQVSRLGGIEIYDVFVLGRYAYLADSALPGLRVVDVADPLNPFSVGELTVGTFSERIFVSGSYAIMADGNEGTVSVVDVSVAAAPTLLSTIEIPAPGAVSIAGRYAYVGALSRFRVLDISGAELNSVVANSVEAGSLQVRNNVTAQGQLSVLGGVNIGSGGLYSDGDMGVSGDVDLVGTLAIRNAASPTSSPANLVQLYAEDAAGSSELKVRDEAGNVTTLSPHNFSLVGEPSEPMAWSYYSENEHGKVNVDLMRVVRLLEQVTGESLVHIEGNDLADTSPQHGEIAQMHEQIGLMQAEIDSLRAQLERQQ